MTTLTKVQKIIKPSLDYLVHSQQSDGGFLSFSSPSRKPFSPKSTYRTTFITSLILTALSSLPQSKAQKTIVSQGIAFLLREKNEHWSYNYWSRVSEEAKEQPYPDDLDDTFCALSAITHHAPELLDGRAFAHITSLLTTVETREGGPYRTWLVPKSAAAHWKDVDLAVNSNIAYFLSLHDISLPNLTQFLEEAIVHAEYASPYYPSPYPLIYFVGRAYQGNNVSLIRDYLLARQEKNGSWNNNPLDTALSMTTLLRLGVPDLQLSSAIEYLLAHYKDNHWPAIGFCLDPAQAGTTHYAGSEALTTAFCLEAFNLYTDRHKRKLTAPSNTARDKIYQAIEKAIHKRLDQLSPELKKQAQPRFDQIKLIDQHSPIILLPFFWHQSLGPQGERVSPNLVVELGVTSFWGWLAHTVFDDFLDEEGKVEELPLATLALREMVSGFTAILPTNKDFHDFAQQILDQLDAATTWEVTHTHLGPLNKPLDWHTLPLPPQNHFSHAVDRSLGHAIASAAVFFASGYTVTSPKIKLLINFFRHYILARQLNDDAHDWEDDLRRGHVNSVAGLILQEVIPTLPHRRLSFKSVLKRSKEYFWHETIAVVSKKVLTEASRARLTLKKMDLTGITDPLLDLLISLERAAYQARDEQIQTKQFLASYKP